VHMSLPFCPTKAAASVNRSLLLTGLRQWLEKDSAQTVKSVARELIPFGWST